MSDKTDSSRIPRRGLNRIEVAALCVLTAAATWYFATERLTPVLQRLTFLSGPAFAELEPLRHAYGPERSSRNYEEWIIRDYFKDRRDGVFLDVGANHYRDQNNTYYLETSLGWSGVAIDALPEFGPDYVAHRPRTKFVAMFAADTAGGSVEFFVPGNNNLVASSNRQFTERYARADTTRSVPTTTLNAVLDQAGIERLDLVTMDIELAEPKALAGFDIRRFAPEFVCIEGHADVRQQILEYFAREGYVLVGKYLRADPYNLYFQRLATETP